MADERNLIPAHPKKRDFTGELIVPAIRDAFIKLDPRVQLRNPVMFVVEVGAVLTTFFIGRDIAIGVYKTVAFNTQIALWLWLTVVFANFAEAMAEGRGKAQAAELHRSRSETTAKKIVGDKTELVPAPQLHKGDIVLVEAGDTIPGDGQVIEGIASVDESVVTGESAPVIRETAEELNNVIGGTRVLSDWIKVRIAADPGETFLDRIINLVEGAKRKKTPNEIALTILLVGLTIVFLLAVATLEPFAIFSGTLVSVPILTALLVCLIPTTIGGLLSAIGIAGMDRLLKYNILAMSGRAVEAAGDVDTLLLDKTGTITLGNRMATEFIPAPGVSEDELADAAQLASLADDTPEGRSIVILAKNRFQIRHRDIEKLGAVFVPFSAHTRMSGVDLPGEEIRKGAYDSIEAYVTEKGGAFPPDVRAVVEKIANEGGTPLVVAKGPMVLGVIYLKDVIKGGIKERFAELRSAGIKTIMVTGDNPLTAAAIAAEAGVDDFLAQANPENKLELIRDYQADGRLVAMTGDGTNDAPALAQADVAVAMHTGTQAAKEAGNMVDLDSNPTKLLEVVQIGKQLLMTRGALTTFSIANDVAKYFAIIPALFVTTYPQLKVLNIMRLTTPQSAILSAVIFNALIIIALVPLALRGVKYRPLGANALLGRNIIIYGVGGLVIPFIGIKLIDLLIIALRFV